GPGRRGAQRARQTGGTEPPRQPRVEVVLGQQAVRAAVRIREDRRAPVLCLRALHAIDDELHRLVPGHTLELAFTLAALTDRGVEQPVGPVHAIAELADLRADVAIGHRIAV